MREPNFITDALADAKLFAFAHRVDHPASQDADDLPVDRGAGVVVHPVFPPARSLPRFPGG